MTLDYDLEILLAETSEVQRLQNSILQAERSKRRKQNAKYAVSTLAGVAIAAGFFISYPYLGGMKSSHIQPDRPAHLSTMKFEAPKMSVSDLGEILTKNAGKKDDVADDKKNDESDSVNSVSVSQEALDSAKNNDDDVSRRLALAPQPVLTGDEYYRQGRFEQALEEYKKESGKKPNDQDLTSKIANTLYRLGRLDEAQGLASELIRSDPSYRDAHILLGDVYHARHRMNLAVAEYEKSIMVDPQDHLTMIKIGQIYLDNGLSTRAIPWLEKAYDCGHQDAAVSLSDAYLYMGDHEKAEDVIRKSLTKYPEDVNLLNSLSHLLMLKDDLKEAETIILKGLEIYPKKDALISNYGILLAKSGRSVEAYDQFKKAIELDPCNPNTLLNLGIIEEENGDRDAAWDHYQKAMLCDPYTLETYSRLEAMIDKSDSVKLRSFQDMVITFLENELEINPSNVPAVMKISYFLQMTGNHVKAKTHLQDAIRTIPNHSGLRMELADFFMQTHQYEAAKEELLAWQKLDHLNPAVYHALGMLYLRHLDDIEGAVEAFDREADIKKKSNHPSGLNSASEADSAGYASKGKKYLESGKLPAAVKELEKAMVVDPRLDTLVYLCKASIKAGYAMPDLQKYPEEWEELCNKVYDLQKEDKETVIQSSYGYAEIRRLVDTLPARMEKKRR